MYARCRLPVLVLAAVGALAFAPAASAVEFGPATRAALPKAHLFDIGAADYDEDGNLDLFTTNHKYVAAILHNDGRGHFDSKMGDVGLIPDPEFPGLALLKTPPMEEPGIYLYLRSPSGKGAHSYVYIRAVGMGGAGKLTFATSKVDVVRSAHASVTEGTTDTGQPTISFDARKGAVIDIALRHIDLPIAASFDDAVDPADVLVGTRAVPARERSFLMTLRDRHGLAFANLGGDEAADVFAASGGLGGGIKLPGYRGVIQDELLIAHGRTFTDEGSGSGLEKGSCRGRETAAVDVDGDGALDIFEGCEGRPPRIYRQVAPGRFKPFPAPRSIASTFRWADVSGDGTPELLAAERAGIRIYSFGPDGPRLRQRLRGAAREGKVAQFALADLEPDGDLDVLAVSKSGNAMLKNHRGRLRRVPMGRAGLPRSSVAASFVDFDNDGRLDVHLVPQGLYHRVGNRAFRPTGLVTTPRVGAAVTSWFDYDNDGLRDPVIATGPSPFSKEKRIRRARNLGPGGHWLEADLVGPEGNEQAIGARMRVRCGSHRSFGFVGQSDDSRYSQGHYRLYFGLGPCAKRATATVRWPDGKHEAFGPLRTGRVVRLTYATG